MNDSLRQKDEKSKVSTLRYTHFISKKMGGRMSQERVLVDVDFNKLDQKKKNKAKNVIVEALLTEFHYARDIHFFVTSMEQWLMENKNIITGANSSIEIDV